MKIELSDTAFLDLIEEKARNGTRIDFAEYVRLDDLSLRTGAVQVPGDLGILARVNAARQRIIDRVTEALVEHNVPRYLHTFTCAGCGAAWMADSWLSHPLAKCPNTACHEPSMTPTFTEDRGMRR